MKWIGLTGGIATGKSTVSKMLRDLGYAVVDADLLAREVTARGSKTLQEIVQAFGPEMVGADGELNRASMAKVVFADAAKREKLEKMIHPRIQELRARERRRIEQAGADLAFYDVPLLFEKNMQDEFDAVILVYASPGDQASRLRERNHFSDEEIARRLSSQIPIDDKVQRADYVILNQGSLADLAANLQTVLHDLKS